MACLALIWGGTAHGEPAAAPEPAPTSLAASAERMLGKLTYYGRQFAGRKTASGELFDPELLTMAHRTLPLGTLVRVTNPANRRSVVVRVNDRGPVSPHRIGDVSLAAARELKMLRAGVLHAQLEVVAQAE